MKMKNRKPRIYLVSISIPLSVGALAGYLTRSGIANFQNIQQSALTPPPIVFPVVWTILYTLMGISAARIWMAEDSIERDQGLNLYLLQLIVNFFWSLFFFNMQSYGLSLLWVLGLWVLIGLMIRAFHRVDPVAARLQIPYFLWVSFATYLTYQVWRLNSSTVTSQLAGK